jgi:hypothetical protein
MSTRLRANPVPSGRTRPAAVPSPPRCASLSPPRAGVRWEPVDGGGALGSVMDPREGTDRYDGGATGITDVVYVRGVFVALINVRGNRGRACTSLLGTARRGAMLI